MPVVGVGRDKLFQRLGEEYTRFGAATPSENEMKEAETKFDELCFEFGIELDDVTSEAEMVRKERAASAASSEAATASEEVIYRIDIPANRYDMLCLEGIARALNVFRGVAQPPEYKIADTAGPALQRMIVERETALIRPFVVAAVLRGVSLDKRSYDSFIDLQDKLHQNLCRQRSLVAIGTHDLAKLKEITQEYCVPGRACISMQGPFTYRALDPQDINFVPLKQTESFQADRLLQHYLQHDQKLRKFVPLIHGSPLYPVIYDSACTVLSLPPIINGAHSAITLDTKDVFIECTATDLTKANIVLNTVVAMFSEYCAKPFEVEPVEVTDSLGNAKQTPELSMRELTVEASYVNWQVGIDLPPQRMAELLTRMQLVSTVDPDGATLTVRVPPTRSDVLHACDVAEDVAVAHGYNAVPTTLPRCATIGRELPINQLTELLRIDIAAAGFTEILTWALCSMAENFDYVQRPRGDAVQIGNPATAEFQVARTQLLPSALKTVAANKDAPLPLRLFEISDVILLDTQKAVGARNERRLVAVQAGKEAAFEVLHGLLNRVMEVLGVPLAAELGGARSDHDARPRYSWRPADNPEFFPGRSAEVVYQEQAVGHFGIIHPTVLESFGVGFPVSALEISLEPFCMDQLGESLMHSFTSDVPAS